MDNNIHVNDEDGDENIEENFDQNLDGENITITFSNGNIMEDSPFSIIKEERENNEEETREDELQNEVQESIKEEDIEKIFETTNSNTNNGEKTDLVPKPRKYQDEDVSHPNWPKHKKHVFILSNAGKPIYARYGDESKLAPFMGVLQAIVSFVDDLDDEMRCILAGEHKIVFLVKGPLYFAIVAKSTESEKILEKQLEYVYYQIIALLTTGINKIYETKSHFDLRGLLGGAEKFMDSLIHSMDYLPQFLLASVHCLRLPKAVRSSVGSLIKSSYTKDLIFALLISNNRLIHLVRPKKHILHPLDLHLIFNFVNNSVSFRSSESWTPLCLPHFNDKGFLHCFICFITPEICCLLISTKPEKFYEMRETKNLILQKLEETNSLEELNKAAKNSEYRISDINQPVPHLLHFLYKSQNTSQFTAPAFTSPYHQKKHQKRLFRLYQHVYQRMRSTNEEERIWFHISSYESILGWIGVGFELYATFGPLITKKTAIKVSNSLLMWIKRNEEDLFILNSPVW